MKICFIGGGNMATALAGGMIAKGASPASISVVEPRPEARQQIAARFGVTAHESPADAVPGCEVIVLAVKPQKMQEAVGALHPVIREQLVISIVAGTRIADISRWLGGPPGSPGRYGKIVRTMPNTPALIGQGISGLFAPPDVGPDDRKTAESIMSTVGETLWLEHEDLIDAVTAVSGSGPAYVFYFMEALQQGAEMLGFTQAEAKALALATFRGAALLAADSADPPAVLRERVTSKGGTTEAALREFAAAEVREAIIAAVAAANKRGRELGELLGKD